MGRIYSRTSKIQTPQLLSVAITRTHQLKLETGLLPTVKDLRSTIKYISPSLFFFFVLLLLFLSFNIKDSTNTTSDIIANIKRFQSNKHLQLYEYPPVLMRP